jgi:ribosomal protein S18 acetylase RimI-like enzyme
MMTTALVEAGKLAPGDIDQIVALHRQELEGGFLSSLGAKPLHLIYETAAQNNAGVLIAAHEPVNGSICGFVCGATQVGAFYQEFLRRHLVPSIIALAPRVLNPAKLLRVVETLFYPTRKTVLDLPAAELLVIAVNDTAKGSGTAQTLFMQLAGEFHQRGVTKFKVVAGQNLVRAQRFYQRLGPVQVASLKVHRGEPSSVFIYDTAKVLSSVSQSRIAFTPTLSAVQ